MLVDRKPDAFMVPLCVKYLFMLEGTNYMSVRFCMLWWFQEWSVWANGEQLLVHLGFTIAEVYQDQSWSQGLLSQYGVKEFKDIF